MVFFRGPRRVLGLGNDGGKSKHCRKKYETVWTRKRHGVVSKKLFRWFRQNHSSILLILFSLFSFQRVKMRVAEGRNLSDRIGRKNVPHVL